MHPRRQHTTTYRGPIVGAILQYAKGVRHLDRGVRHDLDQIDARIVGDQRGVPEARAHMDVGLGLALHVEDLALEQHTLGGVLLAALRWNEQI